MRTNISYFARQKKEKKPIPMITAYDATSAFIVEKAGIQTILVGDSLGMVIQGHDTTLPVTLDEMLYHCKMVVRGAKNSFVIGDMPFMTYNINPDQALENAGRFLQEAGVQAVKVEGGVRMAPTIRRLVENGVPVMAHIGLTPQSVHLFGGWRVQGKSSEQAARIVEDAHAIQEAGAFSVVLELLPSELAAHITQILRIPTIGIGAGPFCDGQVQVFHDVLGLIEEFQPKHARRYAMLGAQMYEALSQYTDDVEAGRFPTEENSFSAGEDIIKGLYSSVGN